jgi:hypothetical protein
MQQGGWAEYFNKKQKRKRYTSSERGMVNLFEIVINAMNEACKMPEGLRGSPELGAMWP